METERSGFRPIYNLRPEKDPSTTASGSANQETRLRRRIGRIRRNEEKSHETE